MNGCRQLEPIFYKCAYVLHSSLIHLGHPTPPPPIFNPRVLTHVVGGVADLGFIPDPGSNMSKKRGGGKRLVDLLFFVALKLKTVLFFNRQRKKFEGSVKNLSWIPDPRSRGQQGTGSRMPEAGFATLTTGKPSLWHFSRY